MTDPDLAAVVARLAGALREAGVAVGPDRCERFARAVLLIRPAERAGLLRCAVATLAASRDEAGTVARVFAVTFGGRQDEPTAAVAMASRRDRPDREAAPGGDVLARVARAARERPRGRAFQAREPWDGGGEAGQADGADAETGRAGRVEAGGRGVASTAERLAGTDFAELSQAELLLLAGAMRRLTLAVPVRRSRRQRRGPRGRAVDLRATLRQARRSGAVTLKIIRKSPAGRPRKLILLCDISGSMEPYARAMLQLLYCAAGGARAEVFSFATRLTRLTRALAEPRPGLALQRAGQAAPDWLGGTRIGASLREFNDSFGRRGPARGAVVVIVSDGWDTGDPEVVRREMERLSRIAFRIVWVNPRAHRPGYRPLAGGMAAAWPYCDAVVSAHRLDALGELTSALADPVRRRRPG
jgi:uncharacterized protein with von Willebrand factor type A (vWA) domain